MERIEAHKLMRKLLAEETPLDFVRTTLVNLAQKTPTAKELLGFLDGLLELAVPMKSLVALDLCGTGGDGKNTFNISTATAFVLSAMGIPVAKHGNSASSSKCGSSDVLKALGVDLPTTPEGIEKQFKRAGLTFLHAPFFHPALKRVAPIRKELEIKTIFNLLGPLANPVRPSYQLIGVADETLLEIYSEVLKELKRDFVVVHTKGGYDEITLTEESYLYSASFRTELNAADFDLNTKITQADLCGGETAEENALLIRELLSNRGTAAQNYVVAANTAAAAKLYYPEKSYAELFEKGLDVIKTGTGLEKLELVCKQS